MNISDKQLRAQFLAARDHFPFIDDVEAAAGLPTRLLYAVGSRETNLRNVIGDNGHGFGVWQRDNRSFDVDADYLKDVHRQAGDAAALLAQNRATLGTWPAACAAYNAGPGNVRKAIKRGRPVDSVTTGGDYSTDVMARMTFLQGAFAPGVPKQRSGGGGGTVPARPAHLVITVRRGDTLGELAVAHHTTVRRLQQLNHIPDPDVIFEGQRLVVA